MNNEEINVPFDPDFDQRPGLFSCLGPVRAFWGGLILSLLVLMSVGFLILVL